jgi:hypothetical protein
MAALAPLLANQSVLPGDLALTAQLGLALLDQNAQELWVLLEHGTFLSGEGDRAGAVGDGSGEDDDAVERSAQAVTLEPTPHVKVASSPVAISGLIVRVQ